MLLDGFCMCLVAVPSAANRRESTRSQNSGQNDPAASDNGSSAQAGTRGSGGSSAVESEMRLFPIRTVFAAVPATGGQVASEPSRSSMGILFPLLARVQRVTTSGGLGNSRAAQGSEQHHTPAVDPGSQSIPDPAVELQNLGTLGVDGSSGSFSAHVDGPGLSAQLLNRIEQWLRTVLPGEHQNGDSSHSQGTQGNSVTGHVGGNAQNENSEAAVTVSEEGAFFSNMLQQLMPLISENGGSSSGSNNSPSEASNPEDRNRPNSRRGQGNAADGGSSSHRQDDPSLQLPDAKRQKRE